MHYQILLLLDNIIILNSKWTINLLLSLDNEVEITSKWLCCVIQKHNGLFLEIVVISSSVRQLLLNMLPELNEKLCWKYFTA